MPHPFELDLEAIKKEAQEAAFFHDNINAACPYPFATMAGSVFKEAFHAARQAMAQIECKPKAVGAHQFTDHESKSA